MHEHSNETPDGRLARRAQRGDREAFAELYRRYLTPILRFISFRVNAQEDAEDLTGQVFYRAWRALPSYREQEAGVRAWLYRIARNLVIDYYRTHKRHEPLSPLLAAPARLEMGTDPDALLAATEVREAVGRLPEEQQTVLVLRFVEGLSHAEVAEALGKSEGACRMIQLRALRELANAMDDQR